jgi:small-conductance mechanosensitive channel
VHEVAGLILNSFGITSFGGIGLTSASFLLALLVLMLPRGRRAKARLPFAMLVAYALLGALGSFIPEDVVASRPVSVLSTFLLLSATARIVFLLIVDAVFAGRLGRPLPKILRDILQGIVFLLVIMATLRSMGVEPGSLLTTSALLTAVIGLSLQDTLGNLFAGLSIQAQTPFEVGDWIGFDDHPRNVGHVIEINWRATKIITHEEIEIIIPNGALAKAPIRNFSKPSPFTRRTVEVGCDYDVSPSRVRAVILASIQGAADVLDEPPPTVAVGAFGPSSVDYQVHFYVSNFARRFAIESLVRERIWYALKRARISIPYPIREVHTHVSSDEGRAAVAASERDERAKLLGQVDFLAVLPEDAMATLAALVETRLYGPGELVLEQGAQGDELFIVVRGQVGGVVGAPRGSVADAARARAVLRGDVARDGGPAERDGASHRRDGAHGGRKERLRADTDARPRAGGEDRRRPHAPSGAAGRAPRRASRAHEGRPGARRRRRRPARAREAVLSPLAIARSLYFTPAALSSFASSPLSCISVTMSQPPTNLPFT